MILYYAMGGGLGHLTRSLAILKNASRLGRNIRLMTASPLASLVRPLFPCPVDIVDDVILSSTTRYYSFLRTYIETYKIKALVLDTFPGGIVGEWTHIAPDIPRILIARYLNSDIYFKKVKPRSFRPPMHILAIEPLEKSYMHMLRTDSTLDMLDAPITLLSEGCHANMPRGKDKWLVVHSGSEMETRTLIKLAEEKTRRSENRHITLDTCFRQDRIYPAESIIPRYNVIISGAGYNMVSIARTRQKEQTFILHPFKRKFDDQFKRLENLRKGKWLEKSTHGAEEAADYLTHTVTSLI